MAFSRCNGSGNGEKGWLVGRCSQWMDGTLDDVREEPTLIWATFLLRSVANKLHHSAKNRAVSPLFGRSKAERRRKNGSFGITTSGSIVLGVMLETNDPSLDKFHWNNALISHFTTSLLENGVFAGFYRLKRPCWRDLLKALPVNRLYLMQW